MQHEQMKERSISSQMHQIFQCAQQHLCLEPDFPGLSVEEWEEEEEKKKVKNRYQGF